MEKRTLFGVDITPRRELWQEVHRLHKQLETQERRLADDDTYQSIRAETGLGENITLCLQSYGSNKRALLAFTNAMLCAAQELKEKAADSSRNAPCENPS